MMGGNSGHIISESDPRTQRFYDQIGKEVESYLLPTSNFFEREEQIKRIRDVNRSRTEAISFLKDYKKRIGIHVGEYMKMYSNSYHSKGSKVCSL